MSEEPGSGAAGPPDSPDGIAVPRSEAVPAAEEPAAAAPPDVATPPAEEAAAVPGDAGPPARPPRWHRLRTSLYMMLLAVAAFATGLALFNSLLMPQLVHHRGEVRVPDLSNLSEAQAEQALRAAGLRLSHAGERFDPAVPRGLVLQQDPPPQTPVRSGRRVLVVVSLGEEFSSVPQLFGVSLRGARILIERAGLTVGGVTRAPCEDVGDGLVAATDPPAETVLPREAAVGLLVSTGSAAESFVMPELLGRDLGMVRRQLEAHGFRVLSPEGAGGRGIIILQTPAPGSHVDRSTVMTLQGTGRSSP
jgi:beta-lactam-binding protein with PASTA domain